MPHPEKFGLEVSIMKFHPGVRPRGLKGGLRTALRLTLLATLLSVLPAPFAWCAGAGAWPAAINLPGATRHEPARGMFLVAGRRMPDPRFRESVILLLAHDRDGTIGMIVNRPTDRDISRALPDFDHAAIQAHRLHYGGPVEKHRVHFLMRAAETPPEASRVLEDVFVSGHRDTLQAQIAGQRTAAELRIFFGYAGWGPGQLNAELSRDDWHVTPATATATFSGAPEQLWDQLIERLDPGGILVRRKPGAVPGSAGDLSVPARAGAIVRTAWHAAASRP